MCASYDGKCASTKYFKLQTCNLQVHFHSQILDPLFIHGRLIPHSGKQDRQRTYNVTLRRVRENVFPRGKAISAVLRVVSVSECE